MSIEHELAELAERLFGAAFDELAATTDIGALQIKEQGVNGAQLLALDFVTQPEVMPLFYEFVQRKERTTLPPEVFAEAMGMALAETAHTTMDLKFLAEKIAERLPPDGIPGLPGAAGPVA